ncbi:MAG: hypothetical protein HQK83_01310 [Fibrobacteria bacterium]|nr:hypothetical protein [Fibrobacteria bacterium]
MDTSQMTLLAILAINLILLPLNIFFLIRLNLLKYLLEQPVVKKMPLNIKLKQHRVDRKSSSDNKSKSSRPRPSNNRTKGGSRDTRTDRGPKGRNGRVAKGPHSQQPKVTVSTNEAAKETQNKEVENKIIDKKEIKTENKTVTKTETKTEATSRPSSNGGRRPLGVKAELNNSVEAPVVNKPEISKPEPALTAPVEQIQHGRRIKVKKKPTFED